MRQDLDVISSFLVLLYSFSIRADKNNSKTLEREEFQWVMRLQEPGFILTNKKWQEIAKTFQFDQKRGPTFEKCTSFWDNDVDDDYSSLMALKKKRFIFDWYNSLLILNVLVLPGQVLCVS